MTSVTEVNGTGGWGLPERCGVAPYGDRVTEDGVVDDLGVDGWLTLPDVAERLGTDVGRVRRLVQDRHLVAIRGADGIARVPERFLTVVDGGWAPIPTLRGTLILLADAGLADAETVRWLFEPDSSLAPTGSPAGTMLSPVEALAAGHKTEVRRRARALAF